MSTYKVELRALLSHLLSERPQHLLVYSASWALSRAVRAPLQDTIDFILDCLEQELPADCTTAMPTFTRGYKDGRLDLDLEPSITGALNDTFRRRQDTLRTASAYFSYSVRGPEASALSIARPVDAWGTGSVLHWAAEKNATILLLGVGWEACALKHRVEWELKVPYRTRKEFSGRVVLQGKLTDLVETLYVRGLDPLVENQWPANESSLYRAEGALETKFEGIPFAICRAKQIENVLFPIVSSDPYALVANKEKIRAAYPETR